MSETSLRTRRSSQQGGGQLLEEILPKLKRVKKIGESYQASCPVHGEDKNPSLRLDEKNGRVLIYCFACGASGPEVVDKLGMKTSVLFADKLAHDPDWLLKKSKEEDQMYCLIYEAAEKRGDVIRAKELRRYKLAQKRNVIRAGKGL